MKLASVAYKAADVLLSNEGKSMVTLVKIRDNRFGKVTSVSKIYANLLVKLGKHSYVVEEAAAPAPAVAKPSIPAPAPAPVATMVQTLESKAAFGRPAARLAETDEIELHSVRAISTKPKPVMRAAVVDTDEDEEEKPKRSYTRRDMKAEG